MWMKIDCIEGRSPGGRWSEKADIRINYERVGYELVIER